MNYVIVLAGGVGSRFWPLSRETEPKQLLPICSHRPMLEDALARLAPVVDRKRIFIATSARHRSKIKQCTRGMRIPARNYLFEPQVKNTLAPIAVLSQRIGNQDPEAVIAVVPCDHFVGNVGLFRRTIKKSFSVAALGKIVTFGFPPRRPETGYGYIKVKGSRNRAGFFAVDRFLEKPGLAQAEKYMRSSKYYWNGGVFVFPARLMCQEVKRYCPKAYSLFTKMTTIAQLTKLWSKLPSISVDYAVMEKSRSIVVLPALYGWFDLGSWQAVRSFSDKDSQGNMFKGNCIDVGSHDTLVWAQDRLIATVGVRDLIVVDTPDALLICAHDKHQDVKKIVKQLKRRQSRKHV